MSDFKQLVDNLAKMETDFNGVYRKSKKIRRRTSFIILCVISLIITLSLINAYILKQLVGEVNHTINNLTMMYQNFGKMSEEMTQIKQYVENMTVNTTNMSIIQEQTNGLQQKMQLIDHEMKTMNRSIETMQETIHLMNSNTQSIAWQFQVTNQHVGAMQQNVHEMANILP